MISNLQWCLEVSQNAYLADTMFSSKHRLCTVCELATSATAMTVAKSVARMYSASTHDDAKI